MRRASSAIALIKQNDSICEWIEQPAMPRRASRSGTAMQHDGRLAERTTARLPVDAVAGANLEHAVIVRFDRWI
jgi:phage gpG-like protein